MPISNPMQTHHVFEAAANAGDVEALVDLYEPDGVIVERSGELTIGREPATETGRTGVAISAACGRCGHR